MHSDEEEGSSGDGTSQHSASYADIDQGQFVENVDVLAEAEGGIKCLRELILDLAVRGRLVRQNERDEPARQLLSRIRKQLDKQEPIEASGRYVLPPNWGWSTLGEVSSYIQRGRSPKYVEISDVPVVSQKCVQWEGFLLDRARFIDPDTLSAYAADRFLKTGDLLWNSTGHGTVGRVALYKPDSRYKQVVADSHVTVIRPVMMVSRFIWCWLACPTVQRTIDYLVSGTTKQTELATATIIGHPLPVPPIAEQKRIVAKVEELTRLLDDLETRQARKRDTRARFRSLALDALIGAKKPQEAARAWKRVAKNFALLFDSPESLGELRAAILALGLSGWLTRSDRHGWSEVALGDLASFVTSGSRNWKDYYAKAGAIFVRSQDIRTDELDLRSPALVAAPSGAEGTRTRIVKDDILVTITGANVGKAAHVRAEISEAYVSQHVALVRLSDVALAPWVHRWLVTPAKGRGSLLSHSYGDKPGLNLNNVKSVILAIPPASEREGILRIIDDLLRECDDLEGKLRGGEETAAKLLKATVAHLTGRIETSDQPESQRLGASMKRRTIGSKASRDLVEPLKMSTRRFVLRRFAMASGYRSLGRFDCSYHSEEADESEASSVCLVGLNGSGKSNLIEAMAEVFCFLELINLPWKKVESPTSRYRQNDHRFELEYLLEDENGAHNIRIEKTKKSGAEMFIVADDGTELSVTPGREQLRLLPRRMVGYSSGLNETVSHPFLRTKTIYSEEVRDAAPPDNDVSGGSDRVFDTRTLYMDYESNAAIIICNYVFRTSKELAVFNEFTRVRGISSFGLRFNRKRAGKSGPGSTVRLTSELKSFLKSFARCAGTPYDEEQLAYDFDFRLSSEVVAAFREEFGTAENLFMAMHKWSLLNALILSDDQRKVYLNADISKGALERPPSVPPSDRVFNIVDLTLRLSVPDIEIPYSGLSDGEHQFMQVFGTVLLFSEAGTLFLFDEPESHFNPEWRTKFNLVLSRMPNASLQEYVISTHSPFLVSGSRRGNVYKFTRTNELITCDLVDFETYGASFDVLLKRIFSMDSMIDSSARQDLEGIIRRGRMEEMREAVGSFAESKEKRRLYEAIIVKEKGQ